MAQVVEGLPSKSKAMSSNPSTTEFPVKADDMKQTNFQ
jgi:hypothetical protein